MALFTKGERHKEVNKASLNTKLMYTYNLNPKPAIESEPMTKQEFWKSFEQRMPALEQLISEKSQDYAAYNSLSEDLHAYNEYLVPEITMDMENRFVLVISCDGFKQGSPAVEDLTKDIKNYPNWNIIKYRQPSPMKCIPLKGRKVYRKDILLTWEKLANGTVRADIPFKMAPKQPNSTNGSHFTPGSHPRRI